MPNATHETKLAAAMQRAGGPSPAEAEFTVALAKFLNNGGTIERVRALLDEAAARLPGEGQEDCALRGQPSVAAARQPNGDGTGQTPIAQNGPAAGARPSPPDREREGQVPGADKASAELPSAREPSPSDVKAAGMVAKAMAKTVLDLGWLGRDHVPGGPRYTDLRWRDIAGMVERQLKEGATHAKAALALKMIEREGARLGQVDPESRWVDDLKPETVRAIARSTEDEALKPSLVAWLRGGNELTQNMIADGRHGQ